MKVVITAWKHYFTSSTNYQDPNIALAKQCLRIIQFESKEINECFDLISSLQSLADFGLPDIHPFSVLNSSNRIVGGLTIPKYAIFLKKKYFIRQRIDSLLYKIFPKTFIELNRSRSQRLKLLKF